MSPALAGVLREAERLGFLSSGSVDRHVDHSLGFAEVVRSLVADPLSAPSLLDLGSGGGIPGLVLAEVLPTWHLTLLDGSTRRAAWLESIVDTLDAGDRIRVVGERAESAAHRADLRAGFSIVVARSFGAPSASAECAAGFLQVGGCLVVSEPPPDHDVPAGGARTPTARWPTGGLAQLGLGPAVPVEAGGYRYVAIECVAPAEDRFPRRIGVPARRPLF